MDTDKRDRYREIIITVVEAYAKHKPSHGDINTRPMIDVERDHYGVLIAGWDKDRRYAGMFIHIDIIGDKVWIQYDGTSPGVALDLVEAGIPKEDIVLGFRHPRVRPHTGFALG